MGALAAATAQLVKQSCPFANLRCISTSAVYRAMLAKRDRCS